MESMHAVPILFVLLDNEHTETEITLQQFWVEKTVVATGKLEYYYLATTLLYWNIPKLDSYS